MVECCVIVSVVKVCDKPNLHLLKAPGGCVGDQCHSQFLIPGVICGVLALELMGGSGPPPPPPRLCYEQMILLLCSIFVLDQQT